MFLFPRRDGTNSAGRSNGEAFAAAALILDVRVVELEALVEAFADEVEFGTVEIDVALAVDEHGDAMTLELQVVGVLFVDELQRVGHAGTAAGLDREAQADALAALGEEGVD